MNRRIKDFITLLMLQLVLSLPFYVAGVNALTVSNVRITAAADNSATVGWDTDAKSSSAVNYGIIGNENTKNPVGLDTSHSVIIDGLTKGQDYSYSVKSCDASNSCAESQKQTFRAGKDSALPFIDAIIPRYANKRVMDIAGSTNPFSSVSLYVNNLNVPKRTLDSNAVGASGKFTFASIQLEQNNAIKIIATGQTGSKIEKSFEVGVDTDEPAVQLGDINPLSAKSELKINGIVSEPVKLRVFISSAASTDSAPIKITGLKAGAIGANSIELKWDESKDKEFSNYVVYRSDAGPIAMTKPINYNLFIDAKADTGKSYTYQVTQANTNAKESEKSEPITALTLSGGVKITDRPAAVDIFGGVSKPAMELDVSDKFDFALKLNKGDAAYNLKFEFEDKAGNKAVIEKNVVLDTKRPEVKILSPPAGASLYEDAAHDIDIVGKTKPNARVHLFVNRLPVSLYDTSVEIAGIPNEATSIPNSISARSFDFDVKTLEGRLQSISEKELDEKCGIKGAASSGCKGADRSVTADAQGNFKFEKIDLTASFSEGARINEVPVTDFRDVQLNQEAQQSRTTTIAIIATDQLGSRGVAKHTSSIVNCWSGNLSWDVIPDVRKQNPTFLSTERMAEGTETLYFILNYNYIGRGTNAKIVDNGVSLSKACGTLDLMDKRFNISCKILPSGGSAILNKPDNTKSYSVVTLGRLPNMDKFLENDWKSFMNALGINREMTFPLKLRITYSHDILDSNGQMKTVRETQTTCQQVSYVVDNTLIDPRKVLPDFMLNGLVNFLQDSVSALTKVQNQIDKVVDYVAVACLYTFIAHLVFKIYRTWIDLTNEKLYALKNFIPTNVINENPECADIIKKYQEKTGFLKLKYVSDPDLKKCFKSSYDAWQKETKLYEWQRWSCDRIFGHSSPAKWTEKVEDKELQAQIDEKDKCSVDESVRGASYRAEPCTSPTFAKYIEAKKYGADQKCVEVRTGATSYTLFKIGKMVPDSDNLYQLEYVGGLKSEVEFAQRDKKGEDYYFTKSYKSCADICGVNGKSAIRKEFKKPADGAVSNTNPSDKPEPNWACITSAECMQYGASQKVAANQVTKDVVSYTRGGYARDCYYDPNKPDVSVVSNDPKKRYECCCLTTKGAEKTAYYNKDDINKDTGEYVHESKKTEANLIAAGPSPKIDNLEDMKWSYRYSRIKFVAQNKNTKEPVNQYNPNRYIEGRDLPACFGQNNFLYEAFGKITGKDEKKKSMVLNPFKDTTATLQCAHLTGVNQRLQLYKNLMTSMSNCLIDIRKDGRADAGVCKELFTQHVCGMVWQVANFFKSGCPVAEPADNPDDKENQVAANVRKGFKSIASAISESQSEISEEYQNVKLNNLLGVGEGGVARKACLAAFGYDWNFNARNLVDAAYTTPMATLVQAVTRSREFLNVDPISLMPHHEYRASWIVNPGCDLENYRVDLACVTQREANMYPNQINCASVGAPSIGYAGQTPFTGPSTAYNQCDCLGLNQDIGPTYTIWTENRIKQNVLVDRDYHKVMPAPYRYDHLKFTLRNDRRIPPNIQANCFPTGYEKGVFYFPITDKTARDILDCQADPVSGIFSCGGGEEFFSKKGSVQLVEVDINGENAARYPDGFTLEDGKELRVSARAINTGSQKCFKVSMSPDPVQPRILPIDFVGPGDILEFSLGTVNIAGRGSVAGTSGLATNLLKQNNQHPVAIGYQFTDNRDPQKIHNPQDEGKLSIDDTVLINGAKIELNDNKPQKAGTASVQITAENTIIITQEDAEIEITSVNYVPTERGGLVVGWVMAGTIQINPVQQSTQQQQQKALTVEIFNLKQDKTIFTDISDCNPNDRAMEPRTYKITVVQTSKQVNPIQNVRIAPSSPKIGDDVKISLNLKSEIPVEKENVRLEIKDSNGDLSENVMENSGGDSYSYIYTPNLNGPHIATIRVTDKQGKVSLKTQNFNVGDKTVPIAPKDDTNLKNKLMGLATDGSRNIDAYNRFLSMQSAAKQDGISLAIVSDYRNFNQQEGIWNNKVKSGSLSSSEEQKVANAAQYTAPPGISRHHWGTEFDIAAAANDPLIPNDYLVDGRTNFKVYGWLSEHAKDYSFCQPYLNNGANGLVKAEPWHWSYKAYSKGYTEQYNSIITNNELRSVYSSLITQVEGKDIILNNFDSYKADFVTNINSECLQ